MNAWFQHYVDAFNRSDFPAFGNYYAADVDFRGRAAQVVGREAVLDFYRSVKSRLSETLEVLDFVGQPDAIAAVIRTTLVAREAWPDFPTGPFAAGARRVSVNFIFYDIVGGKFARIRSAPFSSIEA